MTASVRRAVTLAVVSLIAMSAPGRAIAAEGPDDTAAQRLAERYAPVVRMQQEPSSCAGEQFRPTDVQAVLGNQEVALRGPWRPPDLIKTQPADSDLGRRYPGHFLDFPGDPLRPGCDYADWSERINAEYPATVYAHVATDPAFPGQLSLEYWFFYVFNDYNNTHEGDWESIRLVFEAATPEAALTTEPAAVGYSQHGGAERARWGDAKLELVDGTHPVVYPAAGSHANKFGRRLYLGRGSEGLGCDDTTNPLPAITPRVAYVPMLQADYLRKYPWLAFQGRWGERQRSFFDGPTGPNMKASWTAPIQDAEATWRDDSTVVPGGALLGPSSTDAFCSAVATGSNLLRETLDRTWPLGVILAVLAALVWLAASRTRWTDADPLPARRHRAWGQAVASAIQLFRHRPVLFGLFAAAFAILSLATVSLARLQTERRDAPVDLGAPTENATGFWASLLALAITILTVAAYTALLAAVMRTLDQLDNGIPVTASAALRHVVSIRWPLARVATQYVVILSVLTIFVATIPLAIYYAVSRAFVVQALVAEDIPSGTALRRSRRLVRGRWWRTAAPLAIVVGLGLAAGPIAGIVMLLATDWSPTLINVVSSMLFAIAMPLAAAAVSYLYFDRTMTRSPGSGDLPDAPRTYAHNGEEGLEHDLPPARSES
ncbi:hypothetical protein [Kribbella shirazensis]|uniref:DUF946 domain-containing protein n=1 Tax=Kribbella shirazensis TaxID=1105143 RepID=A0A7X5VHX6_9ACTN|nr:hypothetical protein [Kribbella shirazensis]NIK61540.1 hypothetical protein [Kribbella shirazensis]